MGKPRKMVVEDESLAENVKKLLDVGVEVYACKVRSDNFGMSVELEKLGDTVVYFGEFSCNYVKRRLASIELLSKTG